MNARDAFDPSSLHSLASDTYVTSPETRVPCGWSGVGEGHVQLERHDTLLLANDPNDAAEVI